MVGRRRQRRPRARVRGDGSSDVASDRLWAGRRIDGNSQIVSVDLSDLDAGAWHHAAATFDGARFQPSLYLDGVPVAQEPAAGAPRETRRPITVGANGGDDYPWDGELDRERRVVRRVAGRPSSF